VEVASRGSGADLAAEFYAAATRLIASRSPSDLLCGGHGCGDLRARSHCRFVPPLNHFMQDSLTYALPLFLKRRCGRTLGDLPDTLAALGPGPPGAVKRL
jgi:hypothetical protein